MKNYQNTSNQNPTIYRSLFSFDDLNGNITFKLMFELKNYDYIFNQLNTNPNQIDYPTNEFIGILISKQTFQYIGDGSKPIVNKYNIFVSKIEFLIIQDFIKKVITDDDFRNKIVNKNKIQLTRRLYVEIKLSKDNKKINIIFIKNDKRLPFIFKIKSNITNIILNELNSWDSRELQNIINQNTNILNEYLTVNNIKDQMNILNTILKNKNNLIKNFNDIIFEKGNYIEKQIENIVTKIFKNNTINFSTNNIDDKINIVLESDTDDSTDKPSLTQNNTYIHPEEKVREEGTFFQRNIDSQGEEISSPASLTSNNKISKKLINIVKNKESVIFNENLKEYLLENKIKNIIKEYHDNLLNNNIDKNNLESKYIVSIKSNIIKLYELIFTYDELKLLSNEKEEYIISKFIDSSYYTEKLKILLNTKKYDKNKISKLLEIDSKLFKYENINKNEVLSNNIKKIINFILTIDSKDNFTFLTKLKKYIKLIHNNINYEEYISDYKNILKDKDILMYIVLSIIPAIPYLNYIKFIFKKLITSDFIKDNIQKDIKEIYNNELKEILKIFNTNNKIIFNTEEINTNINNQEKENVKEEVVENNIELDNESNEYNDLETDIEVETNNIEESNINENIEENEIVDIDNIDYDNIELPDDLDLIESF